MNKNIKPVFLFVPFLHYQYLWLLVDQKTRKK
ncbi:hypothetical protein IGI41_002575 [Enterococcus sp. DIV0876]